MDGGKVGGALFYWWTVNPHLYSSEGREREGWREGGWGGREPIRTCTPSPPGLPTTRPSSDATRSPPSGRLLVQGRDVTRTQLLQSIE